MLEPCLACDETISGVLQGGYVEPGPGGDPIRNPGVLPTGKNIHALDPQSIPTQAAVKSARIVVDRCACSAHLLVRALFEAVDSACLRAAELCIGSCWQDSTMS